MGIIHTTMRDLLGPGVPSLARSPPLRGRARAGNQPLRSGMEYIDTTATVL